MENELVVWLNNLKKGQLKKYFNFYAKEPDAG